MSAVPHSTPLSQELVTESPVGSPTSAHERILDEEEAPPQGQPKQLRISLPAVPVTDAMLAMEYRRAASSPRLAALSPRRHSLIPDTLSELLPRERLEAARLTSLVERLIPEPRFQQALLAADVVEQVLVYQVAFLILLFLRVKAHLHAGTSVTLNETATHTLGACCQSEADSASSHRGADDESRSSSPELARSPLRVGLVGVGRVGGLILRYIRHTELLPSPRCLAVSTRRADELRGSPLAKGLHLCVFDNAKVAAFADLLILAVPPYQLDAVSIDLRGSLRKTSVVVNLAAGTPRRKSQVLFDPAYALRSWVDLADPRITDTPMEHPIGSFLKGILVENRSAASIVGGKMAHTVNRKPLQKSKALAASFLSGSDETLISIGEALMGHCEVANTNDIKYVRSALMNPAAAAAAAPESTHNEVDGESLWHFTQEEKARSERQFVELVPTIDPDVLD